MSHAQRLWEKVARRGPDDCWEWQAARSRDGYGRFSLDGKTQWAHRVAFELVSGPIPPGMCVCHRCDNPSCVNPAHFFLGTHTENVRDMWRKSRARPPRQRFCRAQAAALARAGVSQREMAREFGCSQPSVCAALRKYDRESQSNLTER